MNPPSTTPPAHDDGLQELRDHRRRLLTESGGTLQSLGEHYRRVEARHAARVKDPRKILTDAVHSR